MVSLSRLEQPFGALSDVDLDALDIRLDRIIDHGHAERYEEAAQGVAELLDEGVCDVRVVQYLIFELVWRRGVHGLIEGMTVLEARLGDSWEFMLPSDKRGRYLSRSLGWFFRTVTDLFEYQRTKAGPTWKSWVSETTIEDLETAEAVLKTLSQRLRDETFDSNPEGIHSLERWLRETSSSFMREPSEASAEEAPVETTASEEKTLPSNEPLENGKTVTLHGSPKFALLLKKLEAFEVLVDRRDFQKAALVSHDVLSELDAFDPRDYFPQLFSKFGALLSGHVQSVMPYWEHQDTIEWRMLAQFYRVDLEKFLQKE